MSVGRLYCIVCHSDEHNTNNHHYVVGMPHYIKDRKDAKLMPLPEETGKLLSATVFADMLFICCENGAYYRSAEGTWPKLTV